MPSVLRQSGKKYTNDNGKLITPRAVIHFCEICNKENAPWGATNGKGKRLYYCTEHKYLWDGMK